MHFWERIPTLLNAFLRIGSVLLVLAAQILLVVVLFSYLRHFSAIIYIGIELCSLFLAYFLVNDEAQYKQAWILLLFLLPGIGFVLYFLWGSKRDYSWFNRRFRRIEQEVSLQLPVIPDVEEMCYAKFPNEAPLGRYVARVGYPTYANQDSRFFSCGQEWYQSLIPDLKSAQESIYIEMFILDRGTIWDEIFPILKEKAAAGVDVRLLLDDFGSLKTATPTFRRTVRAAGIRLAFFAPINKDVFHASFNFRTHQKYVLVDEYIGHNGGMNLADEYFNRKERFGYWKDSATRLEGESVRSMVAFFLIMWEICTGEKSVLRQVAPRLPMDELPLSFVRPFAGGPAKNPNNPVPALYDLVISRAQQYLYITTPYLVLDRTLSDALVRAARCGVDVRIMMPGIYDKWYVRAVSNLNFGVLLAAGVRIFEYTPGFLHAKELVSDGTCAICGSVNLDFRSLWEHYECGNLFCGGEIVHEIETDILSVQAQSREISYGEWKKRNPLLKLVQQVLRIIAPLL